MKRQNNRYDQTKARSSENKINSHNCSSFALLMVSRPLFRLRLLFYLWNMKYVPAELIPTARETGNCK